MKEKKGKQVKKEDALRELKEDEELMAWLEGFRAAVEAVCEHLEAEG